MRIAIVTDAWSPQVNGVVNTLQYTGGELAGLGHEVEFFTPLGFPTVPCPSYPSIRLAVRPYGRLSRALSAYRPEAVHIATEGPLGLAARRWCRRQGLAFTTSYHTQFPEYVRMRAPVPLAWGYAFMRWFHGAAARTLVPSESQRARLAGRGLRNLHVWSRGVDTCLFRVYDKDIFAWPRPVALYAGRVAVEKNIGAFLELDLPGTKVVVGDGPDLDSLRARYPQVRFVGFKFGEDLARHIAGADVFVFPSRTDTFGLVLLEAMACGVPVAGYPVTGPVDVVSDGVTGALDEDLGAAVRRAQALSGGPCREFAESRSWRRSTEQFAAQLVDNSAGSQP